MHPETSDKTSVLLIIPNARWHDKRQWFLLPSAVLILTAILRKRFHFNIIDCNALDLSLEECQTRVVQQKPDIVLVSALSIEYHQQYHDTLDLAKKACPEAITVLGGVYPTVLAEEALRRSSADYIFLGHAEERIIPFIELLASGDLEGIHRFPGIGYRVDDTTLNINPPASFITEVKEQARPDYSLIDLKPYLVRESHDYQYNSSRRSVPIITSYGCPYNCIFCAVRTITGRGIVFRPVDEILGEIDELVEQYGVEDIVFIDDSLLAKKERFSNLISRLHERHNKLTWKAGTVSAWHLDDDLIELMAHTGCTQITISVESGSPRVLREIVGKPLNLDNVPGIVSACRDNTIDIAANFVIGFPGETWDDIRLTFRFAEQCDFDLAHFHVATPLPGTDLYSIAKEQHLLPDDFSFFDPDFFGFGNAFIENEEFTREELLILRSYEWDRINFSTPEKTEKVMNMYRMTPAELERHRRATRRKLGLHY